MPQFLKVSAPGLVGKLFAMGDIAGSTFTYLTPGFSVAVTGTGTAARLSLSCSITPTAGLTFLQITSAKNGFTRQYRVPVSVSMRSDTAPAKVAIRNNVKLETYRPLNVADSTQVSGVFIIQYLEDDGDYIYVTAGNPKGRGCCLSNKNSGS